MPSITLYSIERSPPCRSVLMVLEYLGLEVDIKRVDPLAGEHLDPEFVKKNPLHAIPLLEENGFLLADSHAIITYLVSKYGAEHRSTLYPVDMRLRATVDQRMYFDTSVLQPKFRAAVEQLVLKKTKEIPPELKEKFEEAYGYLEKYLESSTFLACDHVTLADISAIASVSTMDFFVPLDERFVKVREWWNRLKQYDWYENGNEKGLANAAQKVELLLRS